MFSHFYLKENTADPNTLNYTAEEGMTNECGFSKSCLAIAVFNGN
jgi:hypothetical protein